MFKKEILTDPNIGVRCETNEEADNVVEFFINGKRTPTTFSDNGIDLVVGLSVDAETILTYTQALAEEKEPRKGQIEYRCSVCSEDYCVYLIDDEQIAKPSICPIEANDAEWETFKNGEVE